MAGKDNRKTPKPKAAKPRRSGSGRPSATPAPARPRDTATKPRRTMPVHALADDRMHLALAQPGRLRQGYLKTLCGLQAVSALSPFALADKSLKRCRVCFAKVDSDGVLVA